MANIIDPRAVNFSLGRIRPGAALLAEVYSEAKRTVNAWNALSMSTLIVNTIDPLVDGQAATITGAQATTIITRLQEFITDYEASGNAKLNTVLQVTLNP